MVSIQLDQIAYARSGDKGSSANVAIFAFNPSGYEFLQNHLSADRIETYFKPMGVGKVIRFEAPNLLAFNFLLYGILAGGGSRSLRIDAQGKTLGQALLQLTLEVPKTLLPKLQ